MAKHKKDKAMRACTPCFTKRLEVRFLSLPVAVMWVEHLAALKLG